jgi:predicted DNA repair protein MutK
LPTSAFFAVLRDTARFASLAADDVARQGAKLVAVLVRLDDWGLHLVQSASASRQALGRRIVAMAPKILQALDPIGMVAMLAVAGGIFTHLVQPAYPHWTLALLGDTLVGAALGLALAGVAHLIARRRATT